jgi:hypothetical protein
MATIKKAQSGDRITSRQKKRLGRISEKNPERAKEVAERMKLRATRRKRGSEIYDSLEPDAGARVRKSMEEAREASKTASKAKNGKSFPDLNKDGKITKADILKGRGVIAKKGAKIKKAQAGDTLVKKYPSVRMNTRKGYETKETTYPNGDKETSRTKVGESSYQKNKKARLNEAAKKSAIQSSKEISGKRPAKIKKAQAGLTASTKRVGPIDPKGAWTKVQEMNLPPRNVKTKVSLTRDKQLGATKMKMGGKAKAKKK